MSDWGYVRGCQDAEAGGITGASTTATTITAPGSTNTKGAWTELIAATTIPARGLIISGLITDASGSILFDIGIGAASSEVVVVEDTQARRLASANGMIGPVFVFVDIPAGSRVSARYQRGAAGVVVALAVQLMAAPWPHAMTANECVTYGAVTASSDGTVVDPGATANTKGAWTEITSSATQESSWALLSVEPRGTSAAGGTTWALDIGIGAAASEVVVLPDMFIRADTTYDTQNLRILVPLSIPFGARVSARLQCSINTATSRERQIIIHAMG